MVFNPPRWHVLAVVAGLGATAIPARGEERRAFWSGDWTLTLGGTIATAPRFLGSDDQLFRPSPIISIGRAGNRTRFSSRNDSPSIALINTEMFRVGPVARFVAERSNDNADLRGLRTVPWGAEVGAFIDVYALPWLRLRTEVRQGIRAHEGLVAEINLDAFTDLSPRIRVSGGPRVSFASGDYFQSYFGINAAESVASGLAPYDPGAGLRSVGLGGAISWRTTDRLTTTLFSEYSRLVGPAADSSLVRQRGSENQFRVGVSASYRFDFSLR